MDFNNLDLLTHFCINYDFIDNLALVFEKDNVYIIIHPVTNFQPFEIYDLKGNKIKNIINSQYSYFFNVYYDQNLCKNYFIATYNACEYSSIESYEFKNHQLYHKYNKNQSKESRTFYIIDNEEIIKLITYCPIDIEIWNFHSGELLRIIKETFNIYPTTLWKNEFLVFNDIANGVIKFINLRDGKKTDELFLDKYDYPGKVIIMNSNRFGECMIIQGKNIQLWTKIKKNNKE